jgi:hypothetical protein
MLSAGAPGRMFEEKLHRTLRIVEFLVAVFFLGLLALAVVGGLVNTAVGC